METETAAAGGPSRAAVDLVESAGHDGPQPIGALNEKDDGVRVEVEPHYLRSARDS